MPVKPKIRNSADISTLLGVGLAFSLVITAIVIGSNQTGSNPFGFIDIKSILIVVGGTFFLTTASFSIREVLKANELLLKTIFYSSEKAEDAALVSLEIAEIARKKGILGLQKHDYLIKRNRFFYKGISLIIDGLSPEEVEKILKNEIVATIDRHKQSTSVLRKSAEISPAMGLIGTLIGLVQMLGGLEDPSSIGPAMAVALLTTLYGAVMAYMFFLPLASKLDRNSVMEATIMSIYLNTAISVGKKENPRRLEMLINAILPPAKRINYFG